MSIAVLLMERDRELYNMIKEMLMPKIEIHHHDGTVCTYEYDTNPKANFGITGIGFMFHDVKTKRDYLIHPSSVKQIIMDTNPSTQW